MADIIKFPSSVKKIGDIINDDDYLLDLLYKAAMNPKSEITMDDYKKYKETGSFATGGMANINDMTRPVGYENGGDVTRRLASTRGAKSFEDFLKDITNPDTGKKFTKVDEKTGKIRGAKGDWAKYLNSKNIKVGSLAATDELNRLSKIRYVDIASAGKSFSEDIISAITGTEPGQRGARDIRNATNSKIVEIKKVATQAEGANSTKAKQKLLTTLFEKSFPVLKQVPKYAALLSTAIASKAFGLMPITSPTSDPYAMKYEEREAEQKKQRLMKENNITEEQMNQIANQPMDLLAPINKQGGGMMNMDEMIRPLGYAAGGPASITALKKRGLGEKEFDPREDIVQKTNEIISYLNKRVGELDFSPEKAAEVINDITDERRKENPDYNRLNQMYLEYSDIDDFKDAQPKEEKGMGEKIMQGLGELFGGRGAKGAEINEPLGNPLYVQSMIDSLKGAINAERSVGALPGGNVDYDRIKILEIKLGRYERLLASQG